MNFIMSAILASLFVGVPLLKFIEKRVIQHSTGEIVLIEIKEKTKKWKIILCVLFAVILLFAFKTEEVSLYLAITKILFIVALYFAEEQLRARIYLTNQHVYQVTRFRKRQLTRMERFKKGQLYRIDLLPNKKDVYRMYFNGEKNYLNTLDVTITEKEELILFRRLMKENLDLYINEPVEIQVPYQKQIQRPEQIDILTKYFLLATVALSALAIAQTTIFLEGSAIFSEVLTAVIAIQFIPFLLYLASYVFIRTAKLSERVQVAKKSSKEFSLLYLIGSAVLPFIVLLNHGMADGSRYLVVHLIGIFLFTFILISAWCLGKVTNYLREKKVLEGIERIVVSIQKRQKKNA